MINFFTHPVIVEKGLGSIGHPVRYAVAETRHFPLCVERMDQIRVNSLQIHHILPEITKNTQV